MNNRADAEECVNDAYLGTWNAIPPAKPNPLCAFVCKIVRNISLKRYEYNTAAKRNSIYDVRVQSDNPEYVYEVLDTLLNADR